EALKVNDATIVQADVRPTNGTLHVIDKVLLPPDAQAAARAPGSSAAASTGASTDTGAQAGAQSSDATPGAGDQGDKQ
ncbi:MAG: fasciclin domain-containing protein, partial [Phenylobacterium sp.]